MSLTKILADTIVCLHAQKADGACVNITMQLKKQKATISPDPSNVHKSVCLLWLCC